MFEGLAIDYDPDQEAPGLPFTFRQIGEVRPIARLSRDELRELLRSVTREVADALEEERKDLRLQGLAPL